MRVRAAIVLSLSALATPARADEPHELRRDVPVDVAVTSTVIGLVLGSEVGKADLVPHACRWCAQNRLDEAARDALRWERPKRAALVSDGNAFVLAPATAFATLAGAAAHDGASRNTPLDALIVVEAVAVSAAVNQIVKYAVVRERPYGRYRTPLEPAPTADARLSFYSGHTSLGFALASAAGTVAHLRGYRLAPLAWAPGALLAAFTGYLRIAADKHYLTDVLVGAVMGTAIGAVAPLVFHGRTNDEPAAVAGSSPATFTIGTSF